MRNKTRDNSITRESQTRDLPQISLRILSGKIVGLLLAIVDQICADELYKCTEEQTA